jgi:hypothetical protein
MKHGYYSLICCFIACFSFAQPIFNSIDTLLAKNFEALNQDDSVYYVSLLNKAAIYKNKNLKNRSDSLKLLKPFTDAFSEMTDELRDFAGSPDMEVKFESYTSHNTKEYDAKVSGKILLQVNLLINNTFTVKVPFMIMGNNGSYAIENPMMVMFVDP